MTARKSLIFTVCGLTAWLGWWRFMCRYEYKLDTYLPFGPGFNPPSITLTVEALCVLVFSCGLFSLIDSSDKLRPVMSGISWLGKHTLYVFLYHKLFLDYILIPHMPECNIWIKRVVYMSVMIFGSIAIEYSVHFLQGIFKDKDKAPA